MKQHIKAVSSSSSSEYEREVNALLEDGYTVQTTSIGKRDVGSYDEYSIFQAILLRETEE